MLYCYGKKCTSACWSFPGKNKQTNKHLLIHSPVKAELYCDGIYESNRTKILTFNSSRYIKTFPEEWLGEGKERERITGWRSHYEKLKCPKWQSIVLWKEPGVRCLCCIFTCWLVSHSWGCPWEGSPLLVFSFEASTFVFPPYPGLHASPFCLSDCPFLGGLGTPRVAVLLSLTLVSSASAPIHSWFLLLAKAYQRWESASTYPSVADTGE